MLEIYDIRERQEFLKEVAILTQMQWGSKSVCREDFDERVNRKISKIVDNFDNPLYCKLVLVDDDVLVGFVSIFPTDSVERPDLFPWYATLFVKREFRGNGYSRLLNDAILLEAKRRGFKKLFLKSDLDNFYEKFGAVFLDRLNCGEKLYYFLI